MIEVKNLVKDYGGHLAVDHLSFTIEDGQIYGFLGPNGAGKSTTMNIMTGYLGATKGDVFINGHNILEEAEEAKRCIGYLPEIPPLYVEMTVMEYLKFAAQLKKIPKAERETAIQEAVELTHLEDVTHRLIRNLSKGYKQRVGLAQAVLGMPPVIILDEPTVGLDPKQIIEIRDLIRDLGKKHTVILSSHILSEVSAVCDHIMIIAHGKLIASDTPENLEKQMAGEKGMELLVKGDQETIEKLLSEIPEAEDVNITDGEDEDTKRVSLRLLEDNPESRETPETAEPAADVRERLFYAFAAHRCPIFSMQTTKASLEEVFLELTADELRADNTAETAGAAETSGMADAADMAGATGMTDTADSSAAANGGDPGITIEEEDGHDSDL